MTDDGVAFSGGLSIIKIKKGVTLPEIIKTNMDHARHVLKMEDNFQPSLFIITKKLLFLG